MKLSTKIIIGIIVASLLACWALLKSDLFVKIDGKIYINELNFDQNSVRDTVSLSGCKVIVTDIAEKGPHYRFGHITPSISTFYTLFNTNEENRESMEIIRKNHTSIDVRKSNDTLYLACGYGSQNPGVHMNLFLQPGSEFTIIDDNACAMVSIGLLSDRPVTLGKLNLELRKGVMTGSGNADVDDLSVSGAGAVLLDAGRYSKISISGDYLYNWSVRADVSDLVLRGSRTRYITSGMVNETCKIIREK